MTGDAHMRIVYRNILRLSLNVWIGPRAVRVLLTTTVLFVRRT